jgi:hypothetical protein
MARDTLDEKLGIETELVCYNCGRSPMRIKPLPKVPHCKQPHHLKDVDDLAWPERENRW